MDVRELAKDIYDLDFVEVARVDPTAAAILYEATKAVGMVLEERAKLDAAGKHDTPVHLVVGEAHHEAAEILTNTMIVEGLHRKEETLKVSLERREKTGLIAVMNELTPGLVDKDKIEASFSAHNEDGAVNLLQSLLTGPGPHAPYTHKALLKLLVDKNISTKFSDAAVVFTRNPNGTYMEAPFIDIQNPKVIDALDRLKMNAMQNIAVETQKGLKIRNEYSAAEISSFSEGSRITVSFGGALHVLGARISPYDNKEAAYKDTLPVRLRERDDVVIAMTPSTGIHKGLAADRPDDLGVEISNRDTLPSAQFLWNGSDIFKSDEAEWTNERLKNLNMQHLIMPDGQEHFRPYINAYIEKVKSVAQDAGITLEI